MFVSVFDVQKDKLTQWGGKKRLTSFLQINFLSAKTVSTKQSDKELHILRISLVTFQH